MFPVQAPRLWEEPPQEIRSADSVLSFKALHKTNHYRRDFSDFIPVQRLKKHIELEKVRFNRQVFLKMEPFPPTDGNQSDRRISAGPKIMRSDL